ncbi:conserved protein of unknown function [Tenacibaculum sp. 190524A02b]
MQVKKMTAETAHNVIKALSSKELSRLYKILGVDVKEEKKKEEKEPLLSDADATEYLLSRFGRGRR